MYSTYRLKANKEKLLQAVQNVKNRSHLVDAKLDDLE